ncbi:MAG: 4'-phosphopantetheinyl transferase superfamily protein [Rhodospirillaceae bacterium]|jgi:4'-phosphopantetheinyl transferase|nr:4'-phosphopantetheinyl transferase superfamily protein [Rhodospirillaceae bacterium]MBT4565022.1 4'-phosphopantetheinyl transferase superfamily protein [Rhodospirillaceae bacterium]MBT7837579.1 4'-phosphopantetheinyl transferase superfamily protein [Rhodospirillaceae bacterium]
MKRGPAALTNKQGGRSTRLAFARLPDGPPPDPDSLPLILGTSERARIAGLRQTADKWRLILGRALLHHTLARHYGIDRPAIAITERGRPCLHEGGPLALDFNISHAGSWVVCAFAKRAAIGVDITDIGELADWPELAYHFLNVRELAFIMGLSPERRTRAAAGFWTLKEAVLKSSGYGLEIDPRLIGVALEPRPSLVACPRDVTADLDAVRLESFEHAAGSLIAIAILADAGQQPAADPEAHDIEVVPLDVLFPDRGYDYSRP